MTHLRIALVGSGTEAGAASFESIPAQGGAAALREFKVEIWNAAPGTVLAIQVGGVHVGTITPNARGFGRLAFETDDNSKPFPSNWPGISEGTVVQVGTILSVFSPEQGQPQILRTRIRMMLISSTERCSFPSPPHTSKTMEGVAKNG